MKILNQTVVVKTVVDMKSDTFLLAIDILPGSWLPHSEHTISQIRRPLKQKSSRIESRPKFKRRSKKSP
jgi:hypothetical protein